MTKIMLFQGRSVVNFSGGAEKVLCNMSNALSSRGFEVLTVCDEFRKGTPFYKLDQNVRFCNLSARTGNLLKDAGTWLTRRFVPASFRLQRFLKREKPDVIVCFFISDVYRIKFLQRVKSPIILMQHCYPDFYFQKMKKFNYWLNLFLLRNVAAIQVLLPDYVEQIRSRLPKANVVVIPNAVPMVKDEDVVRLTEPKHKIVYVSRMDEYQKRPHLLLEAFGRIAGDFPEWTVEFWGGGASEEYAQKMEALVLRYNLVGRTVFMGTTDKIMEVYKNADVFVITSTFEGFPLAMTEAMSCGLPVVGFKTASAVNELVRDGRNGLLVDETVDALAAGLRELMSSPEKRVEYGSRAHEDMKAYAPDIIWNQWAELINKIVK